MEKYCKSCGVPKMLCICPKKKKKSNRTREREYCWKFIKKMRKDGARAEPIRDMGIKNPYDGFLYHVYFMPFEAKFKEGGLTYSFELWRRDQPHQHKNLIEDFQRGAKPFLIVFWKLSGRIHQMVYPIVEKKIYPVRIDYEAMTRIENIYDLHAALDSI